ncbi:MULTISPECIES: hypothetical protein [unclassified Avibacterium]|uniref:hypothetical protein n=1 Tax=unclassified Avibacterium TaxID=2685287 RepID=UPI00202600F2|nr:MULTISPECIES: hypothetical protein [unclassified Avibacterium]MCW9698257.1 hypothetical protein [Avibacterium sp. 20-129]URL07496.1 hypothetical protein L4F92_05210 [Avibacterium sp. 21-595]
METLLNDKNWQAYLPLALSLQEKDEIKAALLKNIAQTPDSFTALCEYLRCLRIIEDYPLKTE